MVIKLQIDDGGLTFNPGLEMHCGNANYSGIVTTIIADSATFSGSISVGGTTHDDVTYLDSIGIATAR